MSVRFLPTPGSSPSVQRHKHVNRSVLLALLTLSADCLAAGSQEADLEASCTGPALLCPCAQS